MRYKTSSIMLEILYDKVERYILCLIVCWTALSLPSCNKEHTTGENNQDNDNQEHIGGLTGKAYNDSVYYASFAKNNLPVPPNGYQWELIDDWTDEFEGTKLNTAKWMDHMTNFQGRFNSVFLPQNISVADGNLNIKITWLDNPYQLGDYLRTIGAGGVESKKELKFPLYTETRMKANSMPMSSAFWLLSNTQGMLNSCELYATELDVIETVGSHYDWYESTLQAKKFNTELQSNTRFRVKNSCSTGVPEQFFDSQQAGRPIPLGYKTDDGFHRYGVYWISENLVKIYVDGVFKGDIEINTGRKAKPFDLPMGLRFNIQRFGFVDTPTQSNIIGATDDQLTTKYDWVRSFRLVAAN